MAGKSRWIFVLRSALVSRKNPYAGPDARTRAAKAKGYPARSVFKLEEIDRRVRLLSRGQRVLDLGAAPGSWSLYASERVGPSGRVLAVDRTPILQAFAANVSVTLGDALSLENEALGAMSLKTTSYGANRASASVPRSSASP